jgi:D-beta-D-heptose 7-phosphate kinase/D-beta-D-heptose 1-phosphate adenosyltransferase
MKLKDIISKFSEKSVLVLGDMMLDEFIKGEVSRISPEAPVPVVDVNSTYVMPGGAANTVNNLATLGAKVYVAGVIGKDAKGTKLKKMLEEKKIDTNGLIIDDKRPTTLKTRIIAHNQQVVRVDRENREEINEKTAGKLFNYIKSIITKIDAIVVSDYNKGTVTGGLLDTIVKLAKERECIVVVDPKVQNILNYRGSTVITPNQFEASAVVGIPIINETSIRNMGQKLLTMLECEAVLITRGKDGMSLFDKDGGVFHVPSIAQEVFDVTGAGDTVVSTFTLALVSGASMLDAAKLSNFAAGIVVKKLGTATVLPEEILKILEDSGEK